MNEDFFPYKPKQRLLYHYWDGSKYVHADPLLLSRKLIAVGQILSTDLKVANFPGYFAADKAHDSAIKTMRGIFGVKPLAEGGLTEVSTVRLFNHFLTYQGRAKVMAEPLADMTKGDIGQLRAYLRRKPTYFETYGFWLNRRRIFYRESAIVAFGASIAMGGMQPGEDYFRAISESDVEAKFLSSQYMSR